MAASLMRLEAWFRQDLPQLNRAVLSGAPRTSLAEAMAAFLPDLPSPAAVSIRQAQRMIIGLGLAGASVARHYQEHDPGHRQHPERAFDGLRTGPDLIPFRDYFAGLAERSGTGHYERDTYASLVIWNVPTTEVRLNGAVLAVLPGVTDDHILSYTGDPTERWFFQLVKRGQVLELAVNSLLGPLADGDVGITSPDGLRRVRKATTLLEALRRLFLEFADDRTGHGMQPRYFMDVFRQFAAHWVSGDIPPSGALDVDAIKRDFMLGTVDEHYVRHIHRILPAMLGTERSDLIRLMDQRSLPDRLMVSLGLDHRVLARMSPGQLDAVAAAHPAVSEWHQLLSSHARASGAHLMLSKRFLFNPQRRREEAGAGDGQLVSNRRGTTGMDETILDRLSRMRREHVLAAWHRTSAQLALAGVHLPVEDVEIRPALDVALPDSDSPRGPGDQAPGDKAPEDKAPGDKAPEDQSLEARRQMGISHRPDGVRSRVRVMGG